MSGRTNCANLTAGNMQTGNRIGYHTEASISEEPGAKIPHAGIRAGGGRVTALPTATCAFSINQVIMALYKITESVKELPRDLGQLKDVDLFDDDRYAAIFQNQDKQIVRFLDQIIPLPVVLNHPKIRVIDENKFLIAASRNKRQAKNAYIFDKAGQVISNFGCGDAIKNIIVTENRIVFTYFDEGIFGRGDISPEGLAVFDLNGAYQAGYRSFFGSQAEDIADCYCACLYKRNMLYFCAYTEFRIVRWDLDRFQQEITPIPDSLHGAHALTTDGTTFYLYSPYHGKGNLYAWRPEFPSPEQIGSLYYRLRGLSDARFLSKGEDSYTLIKIEST